MLLATFGALVLTALPAAAASIAFQPIEPGTTSLPAQVFVRDPAAPAVTDDRGVVNVPGVRRVRAGDAPGAELYTSDGTALQLSLSTWRKADGTIEVTTDAVESKLVMSFRRLIAFGRYSLFRRDGVGDDARYVPLEPSGVLSSFTADQAGAARVTVYTRAPLESGAIVVLVYHSDDKNHGASPGEFGRTAHEQLIVRIP